MRNIDRIRQMSLEELAPLLVYYTTVFDYEDEFEVCISPSGAQCYSYEKLLTIVLSGWIRNTMKQIF